MSDCLFCKIVAGDIPANKVYEDETILAFKDIAPKAPVHILVIPKQHIRSLSEITAQNSATVSHLTLMLKEIAHAQGLEKGFKVVVNNDEFGGQEVPHLHYHILGDPEKKLALSQMA
jgi:histidine triad (HIT) family protein